MNKKQDDCYIFVKDGEPIDFGFCSADCRPVTLALFKLALGYTYLVVERLLRKRVGPYKWWRC